MSSCLSCGTCFPQRSVSIQFALFRDLNGDHEPILWFLFWHQGITTQCVLTQFIECCYMYLTKGWVSYLLQARVVTCTESPLGIFK